MFARTEPWADRIYRVRDTLMTSFRYGALSPIEYHRIAHEGKRYAHDIISFYSQNDVVSANCVRHRKGKKDKAVNTSEIKLSAQGRTVDLLSSFYFIRSMEFKNLKKGEVIMLNIFSGKRKELLTIIFDGVETIKLNKKKIETYKVKFTFTSESKKQTSDPIIAWLSKEDGHIPLKLVGKLPIGQVQCIFVDACK